MTEPVSIESAPSVFEQVAGDLPVTRPAQALNTFVEFARVRFAVPDEPESDSLLFEYGVFDFTGRSLFTISFVRQFEMVHESGEHDGYVQFRCDFEYEVDAELEALGKRVLWAASSADEDQVREWQAAVSGDPCWPPLAARTPTSFKVGQTEV